MQIVIIVYLMKICLIDIYLRVEINDFLGEQRMATLDPSEIMFTPFEPKTKNRFIMYIEGIPSYLVKTANRPSIQFEEIVLDHINVLGNQSILLFMIQLFHQLHKV